MSDGMDRARDARRQAFQAGQHNYVAMAQEKFEGKVVEFLLRQFSALSHKRDLLDLCYESERVRKLRLAYFQEHFHDFPVRLVSKHIRKVAEDANVRLLFMSFSQLPFVAAYDDYWQDVGQEAADSSRGFGLIFNWPFLPGGFVLHNINMELDTPGTRLVRVYKDGNKTVRLVLEDLKSFCSMVSAYWKPSEG